MILYVRNSYIRLYVEGKQHIYQITHIYNLTFRKLI